MNDDEFTRLVINFIMAISRGLFKRKRPGFSILLYKKAVRLIRLLRSQTSLKPSFHVKRGIYQGEDNTKGPHVILYWVDAPRSRSIGTQGMTYDGGRCIWLRLAFA